VFREREASSVSVLRVLRGGRGARGSPSPPWLLRWGQLNACVGRARTGAVSRIYAPRATAPAPYRARGTSGAALAVHTVLPFAFSFEARVLLATRHARGPGAALTRAWIGGCGFENQASVL